MRNRSSLIAAPVLAVTLGLFVYGTGMTDGLLRPGKPTSLRLKDASHASTPIIVEDLRINGVTQHYYPGLATMAWENPRGGSTILKAMNWPADHRGDTVTVDADWVEAFTGHAYSARVSFPWQDLSVEKVIDWQADIIAVYGRNGDFMIVTDNGPDPVTGQYNGRVVAQVCGTRMPARDRDYMAQAGALPRLSGLAENRAKHEAMTPVETPCAGAGVG